MKAIILLVSLLIFPQAIAQDVKYCKDARTGGILTVPAGMPCPYPTHEI